MILRSLVLVYSAFVRYKKLVLTTCKHVVKNILPDRENIPFNKAKVGFCKMFDKATLYCAIFHKAKVS
jgi:hypothetical protein